MASVIASLAVPGPGFADGPDGKTSDADDVDFARDIKPILSDHCFACHGPDEHDRQAGIRLDTADGIFDVVDTDEPADSLMLERIRESDPDLVMPPPDYHKPLSAKQKDTIERWIAQGATFEQHWSFRPIDDTVPANVQKIADAKDLSIIDAFVEASLRRIGLSSNDQADPESLLRRVSLDLTGLPPDETIAAEYLADPSLEGYERLVDRLIDSPAYGEHMARYWLDVVRFADTHGLHLDNYREMWPYRDWVIQAFNDDKRFDTFITEQLAGDLLPDPSTDQLIASGFNRLNVTTNEGGSIYDEVFARNVIDRTDAFGTVFLGLTTGCAVCHDHKFDPITSKDYYSLSAYFNSLDGSAMDKNVEDPAPTIQVPSEEQKAEQQQLARDLRQVRQEMDGPIASVDADQRRWERSLKSDPVIAAPTINDVHSKSGVAMTVDDDGTISLNETAADTDVITITATVPADADWQTLHLHAIADANTNRVGASPNGNVVLSEIDLQVRRGDGNWEPLKIQSATADVEQADGKFAVSYAIDGDTKTGNAGWAVGGHQSVGDRNAWFTFPPIRTGQEKAPVQLKVRLSFLSQYGKHQFQSIRLALSDRGATIPEGDRVTVGPMHSVGPFQLQRADQGYQDDFPIDRKAFDADRDVNYGGRTYRWQHRGDLPAIAINPLVASADTPSVLFIHQSIQSPKAQKVRLMLGVDGGFLVYLNNKEVASRRQDRKLDPLGDQWELNLRKGENHLLFRLVQHDRPLRWNYALAGPSVSIPDHVHQVAATDPATRSAELTKAMQRYFRSGFCQHPDWIAITMQERAIQKAQTDLNEAIPTTLVWKETKQPRQAHVLNRGQYDSPGEKVARAVPDWLPTIPDGVNNDRLGLARWLTRPDHPLTARVAVNRFWQQLFGTGLVKTSEDFGSQGEPPSHPELLDHLAGDFVESGWQVKRLMKRLVMTETYRRSAKAQPEHLDVDPNNRFFARGPRFRLDAEVLRDQALHLAGMLNTTMGGPSVKPPQPSGLWYAVGYTRSNTANFKADSGPDVYRRSIYTFWKRTSPPPQMSTFDAPSRESCTVRRERTNTPLQALLMMNEPQYLESAKTLATRVIEHSDLSDDTDRAAWLMRHVTLRQPSESQVDELVVLLNDLRNYYAENPTTAAKLSGDSSAQHAAWTVVCSTVMNLDQVVCK
ncbi:PSD1 and planctomycete cytochrome C domain-containing protein [Crateriforma spongiae]|uniref:PSD1 and planctomycete cytochrome C domain-containing protein n=1 Tax=Crateriforma spongiae TaxID=2724528 RepID=UPI00144521D0|nr:PSD1 and planctomycete cytochrome C domain-containing protein [Crateriforma spongiae]